MGRARTTLAIAVVAGAALALAAPASATPSPNASCVGRVFQPQAVGEPGAVADRIAEIKGFIDISFGAVIGDFARWPDCG